MKTLSYKNNYYHFKLMQARVAVFKINIKEHIECNQGKATSTIFKKREEEKKRKYQQRVLDVEMGSFTSLVFGTTSRMGANCNK